MGGGKRPLDGGSCAEEVEVSPPNNEMLTALLPPPPVLPSTQPRTCKPRGGMIIISTHDNYRRIIYTKGRWMEFSPPTIANANHHNPYL